MNFNYKWNGGELILVRDGKQFIGTKCEGICCDKEEDYFGIAEVDIKLPTFKDSTNLKWAERIIPFGIDIGKPKKFNQPSYGEDFEIFMGGRYIGLDREKYVESRYRALQKIPESMRHLYTLEITADQKTPTALIQKLLANVITDKPYKIIYLMRSDEREVKIYFKEFKKEHLAQMGRSDQEWGTWLTGLDETIYKSTRLGHVKVE